MDWHCSCPPIWMTELLMRATLANHHKTKSLKSPNYNLWFKYRQIAAHLDADRLSPYKMRFGLLLFII